jgi:hypothetical protein
VRATATTHHCHGATTATLSQLLIDLILSKARLLLNPAESTQAGK